MDTSWHKHFLIACDLVAMKSKDPSTKVGCVIVGPDNEVRSTGFNGFPRGALDTPKPKSIMTMNEIDVAARYERPLKYKWTEHGERNAIFNAARVGIPLKGCILYCTSNPSFPPCCDCARAIVQAGIVEVHMRIFKTPERWKEECDLAQQILHECGVDLVTHDYPYFEVHEVPARQNG